MLAVLRLKIKPGLPFSVDGSLSFFHLGSQTIPEQELFPNGFLRENQGKGNNFLVLVSVAYTLVAETGKMTIRYSEYLLIVFLLLELTVMSP